MSHSHLETLLQDLNLDLETYGVEELRDGFFDASFLKPAKVDHEDLMREAEYTLPAAFKKKNPLSPKNFLPKQWHGMKGVTRNVLTTRAGIKLTSPSWLSSWPTFYVWSLPYVLGWDVTVISWCYLPS